MFLGLVPLSKSLAFLDKDLSGQNYYAARFFSWSWLERMWAEAFTLHCISGKQGMGTERVTTR